MTHTFFKWDLFLRKMKKKEKETHKLTSDAEFDLYWSETGAGGGGGAGARAGSLIFFI